MVSAETAGLFEDFGSLQAVDKTIRTTVPRATIEALIAAG